MSNRRQPTPNAPGGSMSDVVAGLMMHLTARQRHAVGLFLRDLQAHHGRSDGLVGEMSPKVQTGVRERLRPPGGPLGIVELDERLNRLRPHERRLMGWLIKHRELVRGTLADLGRSHSGYKARRDQVAVSVGRIGALADTLADEYLGAEK